MMNVMMDIMDIYDISLYMEVTVRVYIYIYIYRNSRVDQSLINSWSCTSRQTTSHAILTGDPLAGAFKAVAPHVAARCRAPHVAARCRGVPTRGGSS